MERGYQSKAHLWMATDGDEVGAIEAMPSDKWKQGRAAGRGIRRWRAQLE
jgi:hypothetical protein